jgi:integrase/recombinase XerD
MNEENKNSEILKKFKNELNIEGYSQKTIEIYILYLSLFNKFIKKDLETATSDDVVNYLSYLKSEKKVGSATLNLFLSIIKHFYNGFLKINLEIDIKLPKKSKKIPTVLTPNEIKELINGTKSLRNKLIIKFIYSSGVRVSECVSMKIKDLDFDEKTGKVISGKGNKDRIIILSTKWIDQYKKYLEKRNKKYISEYLFTNNVGRQLSVDTIQKFLKISARNANIQKKVSPHTLRHSFATALLENDVNIRYIQQLLGHANLNTTQIYTKVNTNKLKIIKNPLDNM